MAYGVSEFYLRHITSPIFQPCTQSFFMRTGLNKTKTYLSHDSNFRNGLCPALVFPPTTTSTNSPLEVSLPSSGPSLIFTACVGPKGLGPPLLPSSTATSSIPSLWNTPRKYPITVLNRRIKKNISNVTLLCGENHYDNVELFTLHNCIAFPRCFDKMKWENESEIKFRILNWSEAKQQWWAGSEDLVA